MDTATVGTSIGPMVIAVPDQSGERRQLRDDFDAPVARFLARFVQVAA